jgi:hypothetical protein
VLQVVAFSGGKDSTALVLRMAELGEDFSCLFTPTGNELPDLVTHLHRIVEQIERPLVLPPNHSLEYWIGFHRALPSWRMRWCTRQIKILPCIAYLKAHPGTTLCVGLRADEDPRVGLYGDYAAYRYPLREWGWKLTDVLQYLRGRSVSVPRRTDCALCYDQRLGEWYRLWRDYPDEYAKGEAFEAAYSHTFRSAQRDTWPAALRDMRARFEQGKVPRGGEEEHQVCRVCSL